MNPKSLSYLSPECYVLTIYHLFIFFFLSATGLSGTTDTVQEMAAMGMSILAGSAVMLLTLVWGGCVVFGSYRLSEASSSDEETTSVSTLGASTTTFRLSGYGVKIEAETNSTARIMLLSMIPFLFLLLAKVINSSSGTRVVVIIAITITLIFLSVNMIYQAFQPWMQERRLEYLLYKDIPKGRLQNLLNKDCQPNSHAIRELFKKFDKDNDGSVSVSELKAFILGVQAEGLASSKENHAEKVMTLFDISGNDQISEEEFTNGVQRWLQHVYGKHEKTKYNQRNGHSGTRNGHSGTRQKTNNEEQQSLLGKEQETKGADKSWVNYLKAAFLLIYGTAIIVLLGVPLMEAIQTFSSAANISSFYVTYLVIPWATNYKVAVQAIVSARKKTEKSISLTLTELHSGVFMNNLMGLATFLAFVLLKSFTWDVTAEALIVLIICTMMGSLDGYLETIPLWLGILACLLYPISLGVLYLFTAVFGWS